MVYRLNHKVKKKLTNKIHMLIMKPYYRQVVANRYLNVTNIGFFI